MTNLSGALGWCSKEKEEGVWGLLEQGGCYTATGPLIGISNGETTRKQREGPPCCIKNKEKKEEEEKPKLPTCHIPAGGMAVS